MFELYSYIVFYNQNGNFDVFSQNTIIEAKETYVYSNSLSRICQELTQLIQGLHLDKDLRSVDRV